VKLNKGAIYLFVKINKDKLLLFFVENYVLLSFIFIIILAKENKRCFTMLAVFFFYSVINDFE